MGMGDRNCAVARLPISHPLLTRSFPFKGKVGMGMGDYTSTADADGEHAGRAPTREAPALFAFLLHPYTAQARPV